MTRRSSRNEQRKNMNDTSFVSVHAGLYRQLETEKSALKRIIKNIRECSISDHPHWCETLKYWVWAQRETRRQLRSLRAKIQTTAPVVENEKEPEITVTQLAEKEGKSRSVIWGRIKSGVLPAPTMIGRKAFWKQSELEKHKATKLWEGGGK